MVLTMSKDVENQNDNVANYVRIDVLDFVEYNYDPVYSIFFLISCAI